MKKNTQTTKRITLHVSGYSDENPEMKALKEAADEKFKNGFFNEGYLVYESFRRTWIEDLKVMFASIPVNPYGIPLTGIYDGIFEPSIQWMFEFKDEAQWKAYEPAVKTALALFGEKYNQKNVHLVDLYAMRPWGIDYGDLVGDTTYQKKLWIHLDQVSYGIGDDNKNYQLLREVIAESEVSNLTFHAHGVAILIYSFGDNGLAQFDQDCRRLISVLEKRRMVFEINDVEDVALTNYGKYESGGAGYGQSHSYEQVRKLFSNK